MALNQYGYGLLLYFALSLPAYAQSDEGKVAFSKHDYRAALLNWQPQAERGDATAQYGLGRLYFFGLGVQSDFEKAVFWFRKAADQNNPYAERRLGLAYSLGHDNVAPDLEQANIWYQTAITGFIKAAEGGDVMAQYSLGSMYSQGEGMVPDAAKANFWFQKAMGSFREEAERGTASAQYWLGEMYLGGQGVSRDEDEAISWLSKAGEQGDLDAQLSLGDIYTYEQYNRRDSDLAIKWLTKAAERGDPGAQRRLGTVYAERAHPNDAAKAAYWLRREADTTASSAVTDSSSESAKPADVPPSSKN
ncbi:tetratricopeptide repeat protein [Rhizobium mayense]|uniref:Tetratricopeptide repeat protein n=1 Tax=Rhizobium mayense TaxID=1312184 RepID=A0ABT7JV21_9HYPH|nr:tetratricopeptide repeat protein [Rhizobium mayense]MDL2400198.1 tetratricopeptide repeat protein [Rhizobium mayense]